MRPRSSIRPVEVILIILIVAVSAVALYPVAQGLRARQANSTCQSNLKLLGLAISLYTRDYDETYPPAINWIDGITSYAVSYRDRSAGKNRVFSCPLAVNGYAMNTYLSGAKLTDVPDPAREPLIFDSTLGRVNAADAGASWPQPPRHQGNNNVVFVAGFVKGVSQRPLFRPFKRLKTPAVPTGKRPSLFVRSTTLPIKVPSAQP